MAEKSSSSWGPQWTALIAVLVAAGGALFYVTPLSSSRPDAVPSSRITSLGYEDVEARLWQDPFQARDDDKTDHPMVESSTTPTAGPTTRPVGPTHQWEDLTRQISDKSSHGLVIILPVMVQAGRYAELCEQRMRIRVAVLDALAIQQFIPDDSEHIGRASMGWAWQSFGDPAQDRKKIESAAVAPPSLGTTSSGPSVLSVPYEWCHRSAKGSSEKESNTPDHILILWLNEDAFSDLPMTRLSVFCDRTRRCVTKPLKFKVIGPRVSTALRAMAEEACKILPEETKTALNAVCMFSATATAADDALLDGLALPAGFDRTQQDPFTKLINSSLQPGFLTRTTLTDSLLCHAVIDELDRRGDTFIRRRSCTPPKDDGEGEQSDIALVCEWDTFYARSLVDSFIKDATGACEAKTPWIKTKYYLRGIDGRVPANEAREQQQRTGDKSDSSSKIEKSVAYMERPEGMSGLDYLRRLADELQTLDGDLRAGGKGHGLRAIGVLGNDVYDKLLVMRAIRDRLPNVQFFTFMMDARFALASERAATHNLIVCANYGLRLNDEYQGAMPPFRDSSQTAAFTGVQFAIRESGDPMRAELINSLSDPKTARLFTIGRSGVTDLSVSEPKIHQIHPPRPEKLRWTNRSITICLTALVLACLLGFPILLGARPEKLQLQVLLTEMTPFLTWVIPAVLLIVLVLYALDDTLEGEPFAWFDGISIWPTECVRLTVIALCVHFFARSFCAIRKNELHMEKEFKLLEPLKSPEKWNPDDDHPEPTGSINALPEPPLDESKWKWLPRRLRTQMRFIRLNQWYVYGPADTARIEAEWSKRPTASSKGDADSQADGKSPIKVFAQNLWWEYKRRSGGLRYVRVGIMSGLYLCFCLLISSLLGMPESPARSPHALKWDSLILFAAAVSAIFLTFFVLDSTFLNKRVIQLLMRQGTHWPWGVFGRAEFQEIHLGEELTEYLDIRFIAMRTQAVGDVIYFPFMVFFLLIISRNSFFDNWDWPLGLMLVLGSNIGLAITGTLMLRGAAEEARRRALIDLDQRRRVALADGTTAKAQVIDKLMTEVENERRGAFSLLSQYPVLAAILLPSGSVGIWVLLEYLARQLN
jgi:hypothetical protein